MRVVFDIRAVQSRHHAERGIARYVRSLGEAIEQVAPGFITDYLVDPAYPLPPGAEWAVRSGRCRRSDDVPSAMRAERGVFLVGSPFEESDGMEGVLPLWARTPGWRAVSILYDLIPMRFPERYLADFGFRTHYLSRLAVLRRCHRLLAISEASRTDAVELLGTDPARIDVIWAGADARYEAPDVSPSEVASRLIETDAVPGLRPGYVLFTGGPDWRKNLDGVFDAFALLPSDIRRRHQLVVVCKLDEATTETLEGRIGQLGIDSDVLLAGFVEDRTLVELTQAADLVVFPSRYEGFGLPVLEARRCGTPVICGDNSSLVEVLPDPTARFDADDPVEISAAMLRVLGDDDERARLAALPLDPYHTWTAAAEATVRSLRIELDRVLTDQASMDRRARLSVVLPDPDVVPRYAAELILHLADRVEVSVAGRGGVWPHTVRVVGRDDLAAEIGHRRPADAVLHVVGTPHDHPGQLEQMRTSGHAALLMSADLRRLHGVGTGDEAVRVEAAGRVERAYPGRYVRTADGLPNVGAEAALRAGMVLSESSLTDLDHVFTTDSYTAELLRLDARVRALTVPPWLFAAAPPAACADPESTAASDGVVHWFDCPLAAFDDDVPLQALAILEHEENGVDVVFVSASESRRRRIDMAAAQLGIGHRVETVDTMPTDGVTVVLYHPSRTLGGVPEPIVAAVHSGARVLAADLGALAEVMAINVAHVEPHVGPAVYADALRRRLATPAGDGLGRANAIAEAADLIVEALFGRV